MQFVLFFFFKQKPAYELRISDWSSDVCSSDLGTAVRQRDEPAQPQERAALQFRQGGDRRLAGAIELRQQGPFRRDPESSLPAVDGVEEAARARIVGAYFQADGALAGCRQHLLRRERRYDPVRLAEAAQTGHCQQRGIDLAVGQLAT